jgi:hypothetical protein
MDDVRSCHACRSLIQSIHLLPMNSPLRSPNQVNLVKCSDLLRLLTRAHALINCCRSHHRFDSFLATSDPEIVQALPMLVDLLQLFASELDLYLHERSPHSYEYMRDHGNGD